MPAFKTNELIIANASAADKGTYRCRVNAIYFDETSQKEFSISAYTDAFETVYTKRTPEVVLTAKAEKYGNSKGINGIKAEVELHSANTDNTTAPTGNVTITIEGKNYENTRLVPLKTKLSKDEPGNYTITPCFKADASEVKRANYDVSFQSAVYTVIGQTYELTVTAEKYTDKNNVSKDVGTAAISENGLTTGK